MSGSRHLSTFYYQHLCTRLPETTTTRDKSSRLLSGVCLIFSHNSTVAIGLPWFESSTHHSSGNSFKDSCKNTLKNFVPLSLSRFCHKCLSVLGLIKNEASKRQAYNDQHLKSAIIELENYQRGFFCVTVD